MSTLREQYIEKVKGSEKAVAHYDEASPKMRLLILRDQELLTDLQARAVARRLNDAQKEGRDPDEALAAALAVFEKGELKIGAPDPKAKESLPKLAEIQERHPGASTKQLLLELRNAGSISPQQTRDAARALAKKLTIQQALVEAGAEHVLDTVPDTPDDDGADEAPEEPEGEDPEEGGEEGEEGALPEGVEPAPKSADEIRDVKKARTLEDVLDQPIRDIEGDIDKIQSKAAMIQLIVFETFGKTRSTLIPLLEARAEELGATESEIEEAVTIARQQQDGTPPEEAYGGPDEED